MKCVRLGVQTLPVLSSEIFEVVSNHWYLFWCYFITFTQLSLVPFCSISNNKKYFWKSQQPGSCCSVSDSISLLESTTNICLQRKQRPAECQQPHIVTAWSTPPLWDAPGLSCRRVGVSLLCMKRGSHQQEAKGRQRILPRKANKIHMLLFQGLSYGRLFLMGTAFQPLTRQASHWDKGLMRRRKIAIVLKKVHYVAQLNKKLHFSFWANTNGSSRS